MSRGYQSYLEHIDEATERLITRQVELVKLSCNKEKDTGTIAVDTAEIAACTTSMVRAVEDLLVVTRTLKEAWVLGSVSTSRNELQSAKAVTEEAKSEAGYSSGETKMADDEPETRDSTTAESKKDYRDDNKDRIEAAEKLMRALRDS